MANTKKVEKLLKIAHKKGVLTTVQIKDIHSKIIAKKKGVTRSTGSPEYAFSSIFGTELCFKNGEQTVKRTIKSKALHSPYVFYKTIPVPGIPAAKVGIEASLTSSAALVVEATRKDKDSEFTLTFAGSLNSTAGVKLLITDAIELIQCNLGVVAEFKMANIGPTFSFSKSGNCAIKAFGMECFLKGAIRPGETLDQLSRLAGQGRLPDFISLTGKKYELLKVGVQFSIKEGNIVSGKPSVGPGPGWAVLKKDLTAVIERIQMMLLHYSDEILNTIVPLLPYARLAISVYKSLTDNQENIKEANFQKYKVIYEKACKAAVQQMLEQESKKNKKIFTNAKNQKELQKQLTEKAEKYLKSAKKIPIIINIHKNLSSVKPNLEEANKSLSQILATITIKVMQIQSVQLETGKTSRLNFKIHFKTDKEVTIDKVWTRLYCGGYETDRHTDFNEQFDAHTDKAWDYYLDIHETAIKKNMGNRKYKDLPWKLWVKVDFKGNFKDVFHVIDIKKYILPPTD